MNAIPRTFFFTLTILASFTSASASERELTLADLIQAQRRIEQVYHAHQIGEQRSFEAAVPADLLEKKVRGYLKQSLALERLWGAPVTDAMLRAEAERMARGSRMPDRLAELYRALGNDPVLILECLVRPVLVERLARERFGADPEIHAAARQEALNLRRALADGEIDPSASHPARQLVEIRLGSRSQVAEPGLLELPRENFDALRQRAPAAAGEIGPIQEEGDRFVIRVVLSEEPDAFQMAVFNVARRGWNEWWSSVEGRFDPLELKTAAASHDALPAPGDGGLVGGGCVPEAWDNGALDDLPDAPALAYHTAIWTGSVAVVWGAEQTPFPGAFPGTGARYDPVTDSWALITQLNAPDARFGHTAVWTGHEMIVWGGYNWINPGSTSQALGSGGRYDPQTDTWSPVALASAPGSRHSHTAVWTGSRMIVWGGFNGQSALGNGASYDPLMDAWSSISTVGVPAQRESHTAVWTGTEMIIWGGENSQGRLNDGGRYTPNGNTWTALPGDLANTPAPRSGHVAVWTGSLMVIDGGFTAGSGQGIGRYRPSSNSWLAPSPGEFRQSHTAVWTGSRMLVWGGFTNAAGLATGYSYDPANNQATALPTTGAPAGRYSHAAVWTGSIMLIHGGYLMGHSYGRYQPSSGTWLPVGGTDEPRGRYGHTAVWTGNVMLAWGGIDDLSVLNSGFRYDPVTDSFGPLSTQGAPTARSGHSAVWGGGRMIIWGGGTSTGGRYDPLADTWSPTQTAGAPSGRLGSSAVWTGSEMIVWGGHISYTCPFDPFSQCWDVYADGGRYDPASNSWTSIPSAGSPSARAYHSAIWTGAGMVVWGGEQCMFRCPVESFYLDTGSSFDPAAQAWSELPASPLQPRSHHAAVWAGDRMLIWGGDPEYSGFPKGDGAAYAPVAGTWSPIALAGAPAGRVGHAVVWTGTDMLVWGGGTDFTGYQGGGARYHPSSDSWTTLPTSGAPSARTQATAVWTGESMIVWGGRTFWRLRSGGRFFPVPDADGDGSNACDDCDDGSAVVYPSAPQACDGINNDCSDPAWPNVPASELDADGDGFRVCAGAQPADCNDSAAGSWAAPGPARDLSFPTSVGNDLEWEAPLAGGATSVAYDVLRSAVSADFGAAAVCVESNDASNQTAQDLSFPLSGRAYMYLIRVENGCPAGQNQNMGTDSAGLPRSGRSCP